MLELDQVSVSYGGVLRALHEVSLTVPHGECVALLGANGAGKTTVLRAISRNLARHRAQLTSGAIRFEGTDLTRNSMTQVVSRGVVQVPEGRRILGRLTVEENLRLGGMQRSRKDMLAARDHVYSLFPRLAERRLQLGLLLSGGEQQMLAIGRALMARPRLLMLDEPSLGLAPIIVAQVAEVIQQICSEGTSILLIEQNATMALSVSSSAYVLELGKVALQGASEELAETDLIRQLYLGNSRNASDAEPQFDTTKTLKPWQEGAGRAR